MVLKLLTFDTTKHCTHNKRLRITNSNKKTKMITCALEVLADLTQRVTSVVLLMSSNNLVQGFIRSCPNQEIVNEIMYWQFESICSKMYM